MDGLTDQGNIGSIIRTAYAFNADGIIIEKKYFNQKNQHCIKSSSGAIEHLKIIPVTNINNEIKYLKNHNFWIYSLDQYSNNIFYKEKFASKRAFVFGSEGKGIKNMTKSLCDISLKININSKSESLNVSSAVSACLHGIEILDNI